MENKFTFKRVSKKDVFKCGESEKTISPRIKKMFSDVIIEPSRIFEKENIVYGLFIGKKIISMVIIDTSFGETWIRDAVVEKKYRGMGTGKTLIKKVEEELKKIGKTKVFVGSSWTFQALGFWRKMGYKTYHVNRVHKYTDFVKEIV